MSKGKFQDVIWGKTVQINMIRAFIAGILLTIYGATQGDITVGTAIGAPFVFALIFFPFILLLNVLSNIGIPFVGILGIVFSLPLFFADPIMFILHKVAPQLIPTEEYGFISFTSLILVTSSE